MRSLYSGVNLAIILSLLASATATPALAAQASQSEARNAAARIGNTAGLRTGARNDRSARSQAIGGLPLALILLGSLAVGATIYAIVDDDDEPASPAS